MTYTKFPIFVAASAALALGACTDPASLGNTGAVVGGLVGAGIGALTSDDDKAETVIGTAAAGALVGGLIGNQLDKQAAELRNDLGNGDISVVNTGDSLVVSMPNDILFATDSAALQSGLRTDLNTVAANLNRYPNSTVQVIGHTDNTGEAAYNQALSVRRASAVVGVLQNGGVSSSRLQTIGRGEDAPVASNLTPEGRAQNRRVDIVVIPQG